jgi:hypothetical protein
VTLCLHVLQIILEYKPPNQTNLEFLVKGGHVSLTSVKDLLVRQSGEKEELIMEDLTQNEHYRLLKVIRGKMNLDPLY